MSLEEKRTRENNKLEKVQTPPCDSSTALRTAVRLTAVVELAHLEEGLKESFHSTGLRALTQRPIYLSSASLSSSSWVV